MNTFIMNVFIFIIPTEIAKVKGIVNTFKNIFGNR